MGGFARIFGDILEDFWKFHEGFLRNWFIVTRRRRRRRRLRLRTSVNQRKTREMRFLLLWPQNSLAGQI